MMTLTRSKSRKPRLTANQTIGLPELDHLLDVPVKSFERTIRRLVIEFRAKTIGVDIDQPIPGDGGRNSDRRVTWTGLYEAQIHRLQKMDRTEEFLMARRYEFMRARTRAILREVGYTEDQIRVLFAGSLRNVPSLKVRPKAAQARYLNRCLNDLEALRNVYVQGALYMVLACAHRYRGLGVDYADLVQEGNASLFQAIEGFDWRRDVRFRTYAQYWIHQAILKMLYNSSRTVRVPIWVQKALKKIQRVREAGQENGVNMTSAAIGEKLGLPAERVEELMSTRRYSVSLDAELPGEEGTSLSQSLADERNEAVYESVDDGNLRERLQDALSDLPAREQLILTRRYGLDGREPETLGQIAVDLGITAERVRQLQKAAIARLQKPAKLTSLRAFA